MKLFFKKIAFLMMVSIISYNVFASALQCDKKDFSLQLLGSGGPISDDKRASSGVS